MSRIFFSPDPEYPTRRRLRAGWRLLAWLALTVAFSTLLAYLIQQLIKPTESTFVTLLANMAASLLAITLATFIARRIFDRRSIASLGLRIDRQAFKDTAAGFLISTVMLLGIFFFYRLTGRLTITNPNPPTTPQIHPIAGIFVMLLVFMAVAWQEELFARGYLLQNLQDGLGGLGKRWAIALAVGLSSLVFGLGRLGNPNATLIGAFGAGLFGVFLSFAYLRTRGLWLPIGLHLGWNLLEGTVLGFPVGGLQDFYHLIEQTVSGPDWLTGGAFGPEAGLVLAPALALGFGLVWLYTAYGPTTD